MKHKLHSALMTSAVVLVGIAAAQPLLAGRLPWAADTLIHLYRLVELDHLLRHGYLFSRWAPDLAYGYGFPLFNFYAPLSYYAAEIFRLVGMDFSPALSATFIALIIAAGLGMYAWAADVFGQRAGLVAAAAYVTAPYLLYNVYRRGALAEVLAMALMPAILWAVTHLARSGALRFFILTCLLYAALAFGHNITWFIFTPVIILYAVLVAQYAVSNMQFGTHTTYRLLRVALSLLLGLGLSAFFWIPVIRELNSVQIIQVFVPQVFDYHFNFVTLSELLSPPVTVDPNLVLPPTPRSIGLIPLVLSVIALAAGRRRWDREQKTVAGGAAILALGSLFFTLPQSLPIWDALPLLRFVQFPWRFLGPASLALAFLAGGAFADVQQPVSSTPLRSDTGTYGKPGFSSPWIGVFVAGLIVYGFTWQFVPYLEPITHPTVADIARYERESGALGTTSAGDYMPNTVKKLPDPNALVERYSRSDPLNGGDFVIERLDRTSLPPGVRVVEASYRLLSGDVTVESQSPFTAMFDIFYFAGWQARVDGQPIAITPTDPNGLISFPVPSGRHRLTVFFGSTPLRTAASSVSLVSALVLIIVSLAWRRQSAAISDHRPQRTNDGLWLKTSTVGSLFSFALVCIFVVVLMAWKVFYLDTHETMFRRTRFDGTHVASVARPVNANFDNQMALMGYEPGPLSTEMGGTLHVALYWRAMSQLDADYSISAQIVDGRGFVYGQRDSQHPGGYPTSRWALSNYARDVHDIALAPGTPPGQYRLRIGVYRVGVPGGLDVLDANGAPSGTTVDVATVSVMRPGPFAWLYPKLAIPQPDHSSGATLAPDIHLLGYDLPQTEIDAGSKLAFTLYWQATTAQTRDLQAQMQLADLGGAVVFSANVAPIGDQFPTSRLLAGDVMRGPNSIRIPASMPGGTFALHLRLIDKSGAAQGDAVELGRVTVRVPERMMTPPHVEHQVQADLGGEVSLIGYDLNAANFAPGAALIVTVYWQAQREIVGDYKAFVHLLDAAGRLVAGSDAVPANWTRPTTGWMAGEYITDPHTLKIPANLAPGDYGLEVGLYEADSGVRLADRVLLDQLIVVTP